MNITVRSYEGKNNTYHIARVCKTSYEQRRDRRNELLYMMLQKTLGIILSIISIWLLIIGVIVGVFTLLIGIALVLTKDHAITI